jgi:transcriptional regulator with XRE-family HTH domain
MRDAALRVIATRVFSRPAILEATRAIGLTDAEVARLLGCTPMQVNDWVKGRRPIPAVKHHALAIFVGGLAGIFDEGEITETAYSKRARLLQSAILGWLKLAIEEESAMSATLATPSPATLAHQMLARLADVAA